MLSIRFKALSITLDSEMMCEEEFLHALNEVLERFAHKGQWFYNYRTEEASDDD
jgi:hypothetical protein